jgi:hypothetical protein
VYRNRGILVYGGTRTERGGWEPLTLRSDRGVTVVLQWGHGGVTVVSKWWCKHVTVVLQWRGCGAREVLQWCYRGFPVVCVGDIDTV